MRVFQQRDVEQAIAYAAAGDQALHLHRIIADWERAPACFKIAINKGESIAHLFDQDAQRLTKTVKRFGVKVVVIEHKGTPRQHVDLCGQPLRRAKAFAEACAHADDDPLFKVFAGVLEG